MSARLATLTSILSPGLFDDLAQHLSICETEPVLPPTCGFFLYYFFLYYFCVADCRHAEFRTVMRNRKIAAFTVYF
jgi:hypothetical protein